MAYSEWLRRKSSNGVSNATRSSGVAGGRSIHWSFVSRAASAWAKARHLGEVVLKTARTDRSTLEVLQEDELRQLLDQVARSPGHRVR
jgi:hypothetical protein